MDPDCFWGHWGKAMTFIHPLWPDVPSSSRMTQGLFLAQRALEMAKKEKEQHYGEALLAYFKDGKNTTEQERLMAFQEGWRRAKENLPEDLEARLFYGLARLATVSPSDKSYAVQREVGAMAETVLEEIPDHPGGFHYAIHAYDFPPLADHAIRVAKNYSKIAPEIPHALHMPTHIFTRLGYWQESIDLNRRSAKAAWSLPANGEISLHYFHALDYLVYAHLQKSQYPDAKSIVDGLDSLHQTFQAHAATAYALAAMPARLAMEYQDWTAAANLKLNHSDYFSWERFPHFAALLYFAKGIGAARGGQLELAQMTYEKLDSIHSAIGDAPSIAYWAKQVEIQKTAVKAWITYLGGSKSEGRNLLVEAARMEAATEKNPVTPGELLPMREMLGDLYLSESQPALALENYQQSLERNPNRFNSLYGAGRAAEMMGMVEEAKHFYEAMLDLSDGTNSDRKQTLEAAAYLQGVSL